MKTAVVHFARADLRPLTALHVQVPETPAESARGLAGRPQLRSGEGMLFDVRALRRVSGPNLGGPMHFTTIGMLFPLDFIVVVGWEVTLVLENVHPNVRQALSVFADYVVEAPAGWAKRNAVGHGSRAIVSSS